MAWCMLTYTAANGHVSYSETTTIDVQRMASYGISPVKSDVNGSSLFLVGRFAVPLNNDVLAAGTVAWLGTVEGDSSVALPSGYAI